MPEVSVGVAAAVTDRELSDTEAALEQLVDAALVEPLMPDRYRFHDLLRLFARERAEAEESTATRRAVVTAGVDWYLRRILEAAVLLGPAHFVDRRAVFPRLADALTWLDMERENLVRAVAAASEYDLVVPCWQMADGLFRFYELRRYLTDWQQVNQIALHAAERAGLREVEGRMHKGIGYVYAQQTRFDQALIHLEAALAIRQEVGDAAGEGRTLSGLVCKFVRGGHAARAGCSCSSRRRSSRSRSDRVKCQSKGTAVCS
jgi:tetratricopeptide (TPR) repeat protein